MIHPPPCSVHGCSVLGLLIIPYYENLLMIHPPLYCVRGCRAFGILCLVVSLHLGGTIFYLDSTDTSTSMELMNKISVQNLCKDRIHLGADRLRIV